MAQGLEENIILDLEEEDPVLVEWHKSSVDERLGVVFFTSRTRVVIDLVESGSPADELGIYPGQQLLSVNGTTVKSAERAIKLLSTRAKVVQLKLVQPAPKARAGNTVKTVVWAVSWMMINYRRDFIVCLLLMAYNIVVISTLPILKQFLFETALPRFLTSGIDLCLIDMITTLVIIGVTTLIHCQTQYMLDLNKMDGAGFVPLMQRRLTMHITTLPQRVLDQANEIALLAMIQEDVVVLDRVISAFFDLTSGSFTLLCLLPVLATLSGELTCIIALAVPVFLSMQLRLGAFTAKAAEMLRDAEALFMRLIEENLVYARTKRLLGLERLMNDRLAQQQAAVVTRFDVIDESNARNDRRLHLFSFFLETGIIVVGVMLMNIEKDSSSFTLTLGGDNFPPTVCISEYLLAADSLNTSTASGESAYYMTLPTLFAVVGSVSQVKDLCVSLVHCIRAIQRGRTSMVRILYYLDQYPDPWPDHASRLKKVAAKRKQLTQLIVEAEASKPIAMLEKSTQKVQPYPTVHEEGVLERCLLGASSEESKMSPSSALEQGSTADATHRWARPVEASTSRKQYLDSKPDELELGATPPASPPATPTLRASPCAPSLPRKRGSCPSPPPSPPNKRVESIEDQMHSVTLKRGTDFFGIELSDTNMITAVAPGSSAESCRFIKVGCRVLSVNGSDVTDTLLASHLLAAVPFDSEATLTVDKGLEADLESIELPLSAPGAHQAESQDSSSPSGLESMEFPSARGTHEVESHASVSPTALESIESPGTHEVEALSSSSPTALESIKLPSTADFLEIEAPVSGCEADLESTELPSSAPGAHETEGQGLSSPSGFESMELPSARGTHEVESHASVSPKALESIESPDTHEVEAQCSSSPTVLESIKLPSAAGIHELETPASGNEEDWVAIEIPSSAPGAHETEGQGLSSPSALESMELPSARGTHEVESHASVSPTALESIESPDTHEVEAQISSSPTVLESIKLPSAADIHEVEASGSCSPTGLESIELPDTHEMEAQGLALPAALELNEVQSAPDAHEVESQGSASPAQSNAIIAPEVDALLSDANEEEDWFDVGSGEPILDVEFSAFKYGARQVLHDVSFSIPSGARVGVLGNSGSGKSTLFGVLVRLYPLPEKNGFVRVMGKNVKDLVVPSVLTTMEQTPILFDGTIRDNLILDDHAVDEHTLQDACIKARFWDDLCTLPGRLDYEIGHRGKKLSGGQRQRLCLARSLMRQKPILVLDEPVSAQDPLTTNEVGAMLSELHYPTSSGPRPVTVLAITHNLHFIQTFTHIIFVANGTVVECGTKEQLVAKKGHFYRRVVQNSGISIDQRGIAHVTAERLRLIWLFATAPIIGLQNLSSCFSTVKLRKGDVVTQKGADADAMYIVVNGSLRADEYTDGDDTMTWAPGQELGVDALIDTCSRWPITVRVQSDSAILLELKTTDLEAIVATDEGLADSVGHIVRQIQAVREPQRLQLVWPFFQAPVEALESVSSGLKISTVDAEVRLCDRDQKPQDPCRALYILGTGSMSVLSVDARSRFEKVDMMQHGDFVGVLDVLPRPLPAIIEQSQGSELVSRIHAREHSVVLELSKGKLEAAFDECPTLKEAYKKNIDLWVQGTSLDSLRRHWIFGSCPDAMLSDIQSAWAPRVYAEGSVIIDSANASRSYCVILLAGTVQVSRKFAETEQHVVSSVGPGSVLNSLSLLGENADSRDFGETMLRVDATSACFILRMHRDRFLKELAREPTLEDAPRALERAGLSRVMSTASMAVSRKAASAMELGKRIASKSSFILKADEEAGEEQAAKLRVKAHERAEAWKKAKLLSLSILAETRGKWLRPSTLRGVHGFPSELTDEQIYMLCESSNTIILPKGVELFQSISAVKSQPELNETMSKRPQSEEGSNRSTKSRPSSRAERTKGASISPSPEVPGDQLEHSPPGSRTRPRCSPPPSPPQTSRQYTASPHSCQQFEYCPCTHEEDLVARRHTGDAYRRTRWLGYNHRQLVSPSDFERQIHVCSPPPSPPARVVPFVPSATRSREKASIKEALARAPRLGEYMFVVLTGGLSMIGYDGAKLQVGCNQLVSTRLSHVLGQTNLTQVVSATAQEQSVVLCLALDEISEVAMARKRAAELERQQAEATRRALQAELRAIQHKVYELELRLGYRKKMTKVDRILLWQRMLRKLTRMRLFGQHVEDRSSISFSAVVNLQDQVMKAREQLLQLSFEAEKLEKELKGSITAWQALQPPIFVDEEAVFTVSRQLFPLSNLHRETLDDASSRVANLHRFREQKLVEQVAKLGRLFDRLQIDDAKRAQILEKTKQPTKESFEALAAEELALRAKLVDPMKAANAQMMQTWGLMRLKDNADYTYLKDDYLWIEESTLPTLDQLVACEMQATKLQGFAAALQPLLTGTFPDNSSPIGDLIGTMLSHQDHLDKQSAEQAREDEKRAKLEEMARHASQMVLHDNEALAAHQARESAIAVSRRNKAEQDRLRALQEANQMELDVVRNRIDEQAGERYAPGEHIEQMQHDNIDSKSKALLEKRESELMLELAALREQAELEKAALRAKTEEIQANAEKEKELLKEEMLKKQLQIQEQLEEEKSVLSFKLNEMKDSFEAEKGMLKEAHEQEQSKLTKEFEKKQRAQALAARLKQAAQNATVQKLTDQRELEERKQAEVERQAKEIEGASRREELTQLNLQKKEILRNVNLKMAMLQLSTRVVESVNTKFAVVIPAEGAPPPTAEKILSLQMEIEEMNALLEKLQLRCESDGLFVALRNVCAVTLWKPRDLAKQVVKGPSAMKDAKNTSDDIITKEQFTYWLQAKNITYTQQSLDFFYAEVKSSKKAGIKVDQFIKAFDTVKSHPVVVD